MLTESFYVQVMQTIHIASSARAAEMTKLLENSFRLINIAFIDEMSEVCRELDLNIWEIIDLAATKPFGFTPVYPGPAPGGTCIPIDPFYISWKAREHERHAGFIELAGDIIDQIPQIMLGRIYDVLNQSRVTMKDASILILGASYKKDTFDLSGSPAPPLFKLLEERGARVQYHDPFIPRLVANGQSHYSVEPLPALLREQDAVILLTDHSAVDYDEVIANSRLVIDTRNKLTHFHAPNVHLM